MIKNMEVSCFLHTNSSKHKLDVEVDKGHKKGHLAYFHIVDL